MIANIIDRRKHQYTWDKVTAIFEPSWHDHHVREDLGPVTVSENKGEWSYEELPECSVVDAIARANELPGDVTLYLYDLGDGIGFVRAVRVNITA